MKDDFAERLNKILDRVTSDDFLQGKGLGNEIPFYAFDYPPERELDVREHIAFLVAQIPKRRPGLRFVHVNLFDLIIRYLKDRGFYDKALELLEEALKRNSYYVLAWKTRADILIYLGRYAEAEQSLQQALLIEPEYLDARLALARLNKKLGKTERARQELLEIIRIDSDASQGFRPMAEVLLKTIDDTED